MYDDFAMVYDELMKEIDYNQWTDYLFRLFLNSPKPIHTVLEFGCGTGNITCGLAQKGYEITAVDLSESMLTMADEKIEKLGLDNVRLFKGDMSNFAIGEEFDAVICCCDSVNYLPDMESFANFIECSINALKPGGLLTFDMNTSSKFKDVIKDQTFVYDLDDVFCVWENDAHIEEGRMDYVLNFFVEQENGLYERFEETQSQYIYSAEQIYQLLKRPDLKNQKVYGFGTFLNGGNDHSRIQFVAEKR